MHLTLKQHLNQNRLTTNKLLKMQHFYKLIRTKVTMHFADQGMFVINSVQQARDSSSSDIFRVLCVGGL